MAEVDTAELARDEQRAEVVRLRTKEGLSWRLIAEQTGFGSPSKMRTLYEETGRDSSGRLPGKGGRDREWSSGEWCDARCIGSHPDAPCGCRCDGENHGSGEAGARELLENLGEDPVKVDEVAREVRLYYMESLVCAGEIKGEEREEGAN